LCFLLFIKGFAISKNLRYALDIFNFQHIDILAGKHYAGKALVKKIYNDIIKLDFKKITYILMVSFVASFCIRITGTLFPFIFQNVWIVKLTIVTHTFFILVQLFFFICFLRSYALNREESLKTGSFLAIIGSCLVAFIYIKNFCLVFDLDVIPLSLRNYYFDAIIPPVASLSHLLFFSIFKIVQSQQEYNALNRALSSAIIGVGMFIALHSIVLINFLMFGRFNWLEHMPRHVAVGTVPLIAIAAIFILYFYLTFYQHLKTTSAVTASDTSV